MHHTDAHTHTQTHRHRHGQTRTDTGHRHTHTDAHTHTHTHYCTLYSALVAAVPDSTLTSLLAEGVAVMTHAVPLLHADCTPAINLGNGLAGGNII